MDRKGLVARDWNDSLKDTQVLYYTKLQILIGIFNPSSFLNLTAISVPGGSIWGYLFSGTLNFYESNKSSFKMVVIRFTKHSLTVIRFAFGGLFSATVKYEDCWRIFSAISLHGGRGKEFWTSPQLNLI